LINFGKLAKAKAAAVPPTLVQLFEQLDRKATHQILRPVQAEALTELDAQMSHRDVVLKGSTGSGKTLVGLVYAEMMRRRYPGETVVYLCPTSQLIDQVLDTAEKIGVHAETFPSDGPPLGAFAGRSVLVCTYDKMFTARNAFERYNVAPAAVVLDDVHSGIDRVRQKYTVIAPAKAHGRIRAIFQAISENCDPSVWRGIANGDAAARFEVPYWLWLPQAPQVAAILDEYRDEEELRFSWPNIARYVESVRLCISGTTVELALSVPATEENFGYSKAKHRLYMSASIKDGTSLIRDLECDDKALDRVVQPPSDKGAGERMILPVALIDPKLTKEDVAQLCANFAKWTNVVVLTSSSAQSQVWAAAGATARQGREVDAAVAQLRSSTKGNFFAFAQRFDGVDLPDDACRVLVVDGVPTGDRLSDQIDSERQKESPGHSTRVVNRLEQALGRAVRSSADFAATLLVGTDLAAFVGRRDVKQLLEPHSREQIDLGKDIADQLKAAEEPSLKAIEKAVAMLLDRDSDWKDAHRERVSGVAKSTRATGLTVAERAAVAERGAWLAAKGRNHQGAAATLQQAIDDRELHELQQAELMVRMAGYMAHFDAERAAAIYRSAFQLNSHLARPPQMPDKRYAQLREQAVAFSDGLQQYATAGAAVAQLEEIRARLAYAGSAESVENALLDLGRFIGATASRPERETGRGPDVMWLLDGTTLCIEAKSEKTSPIFKADAEQLLLSAEWCVSEAGHVRDAVASVFATNSRKVDRPEDVSFRPYVITEADAMRLVDAAIGVINSLSFDGPLFRDIAEISKRINAAALTGKGILGKLDRLG
jgi:hypothetical protein